MADKRPSRPKSARPGNTALDDVPTVEEIAEVIASSDQPPTLKELRNMFAVRGVKARQLLNKRIEEAMDRDLSDIPGVERNATDATLPRVTVLEITGGNAGRYTARPDKDDSPEPDAVIRVAPPVEQPARRRGRGPARPVRLQTGDKVLADLTRASDGSYDARVIRVLNMAPKQLTARLSRDPADGTWTAWPVNKRERDVYVIRPDQTGGAKDGDVVRIEIARGGKKSERLMAKVIEVKGQLDGPDEASLIAIAEHDIPVAFPPEAIKQAEEAQAIPLGNRTDLRHIPLVTIDGEDARDFDDAVWAEPDDDPANPGGWKMIVAIADVAAYVRNDDALDTEALERGNSVYFPDRVVPMLPEALSNGWCSLVPNEDRASLAVEMRIDAQGNKLGHRFVRALIHSHARLTYERVQDALNGNPDQEIRALGMERIEHLKGAWNSLQRARKKRGTLDLDMRELYVVFGGDGRVGSISPRARFDAHRIIEDMMIQANVCAAESLENSLCMYRVHEKPDLEKIAKAAKLLQTIGYSLDPSRVPRPAEMTALIEQAKDTPEETFVQETLLRATSQAKYSPDNEGHFGLALKQYAHFTSPIRRYSDLCVHRALISLLNLGDDGLAADATHAKFLSIGEQISTTERRAQMAENDAEARYIASYLEDRVGTEMEGRIYRVTAGGIVVRLNDTNSEVFVPMGELLPQDYFELREDQGAIIGRRTGTTYRQTAPITIRIGEADPLTGDVKGMLVDDRGADIKFSRPNDLNTKKKPPKRPKAGTAGAGTRDAGGPPGPV